jgi:hypothetical protein
MKSQCFFLSPKSKDPRGNAKDYLYPARTTTSVGKEVAERMGLQ